jgi:hypothetical protein
MVGTMNDALAGLVAQIALIAAVASTACGTAVYVQHNDGGEGGQQDGTMHCGGPNESCCAGTACNAGLTCHAAICTVFDGGGGPHDGHTEAAFDAPLADAPFADAPLDVAADIEGSAEAAVGCIPAPSGIVSWWTGNGTLADLKGLNPGTADGTVTFAAGMVGQAFVLDGSGAVMTPTTKFPVGSADRTIELWVNLTSSLGTATLQEMFFSYGSPGTDGSVFAALTWGTPLIYWTQYGASFSGGSMSVGVWSHIAATSESGTITLYQDGVAVGSQAVLPYDTASGTNLYIGGNGLVDPSGLTERMTGMADEVTVYNRALSAVEIASIYAAGSAGKCH